MLDANLWLIAAAAMSALTFAIHVFVGGPQVVRPLLASEDIAPVPRATAYYCWHIVSITLAAMAAAFAISAATGAPDAAAIATAMAFGFAVWSVALIRMTRLPWLEMGQWLLFAPITVLGLIGLGAARLV